MSHSLRVRFSIDTGGTFTDIVVLNEDTGEFIIEKTPTTPENTLLGILNAIEKAKLDLNKVDSFFVSGSTTAMNCLLEGKGAKTAYVATRGFRDVPEIAKYDRPELYNIKYKKTPPPSPRELRFDVTERMDYKGDVLIDLEIEEVRRVSRELSKKGVESVAVCYLHSFKNPEHEKRTREIILEEYPEVSVSISSDIVSEHREYERSMTTILDAYLKSTIQTWIANLEKELVEKGFKGRVIITRSDGGGMTSDLATKNPINTLFSGPSGGVTGGMFLANNLDHKNLVTLDMGGTSCDICIIRGGRAMMKQEAIINEWRILLSTMSINTVGAGGGTIAWIGEEGALHVGPQSAGASPGPICYKQGGVEPTITDAALCNGYIDPGYFLGGEIGLDKENAKSGIINKIGKPLNMDLEMASGGILRIAVSNMVSAIKEITIDQGEDPRDFKLLCYGGAGPLFGAYLIGELEMPSVIVPVAPANFSAWGMLTIDIRHDFSLTVAESMDSLDLEEINKKLEEFVRKGDEILGSENVPNNDRMMYKSLDMRYVKQEHTVNVPVDFPIDKNSQERIYEEFTKIYQHVCAYSLEDPAAIVHLRVSAIGKVPKPRLREIVTGNGSPDVAMKGSREVLSAMDMTSDNYRVYERSKLLAHNFINGPALIEEPTTVTTVPRGYRCEVDKVGNLVIARKGY